MNNNNTDSAVQAVYLKQLISTLQTFYEQYGDLRVKQDIELGLIDFELDNIEVIFDEQSGEETLIIS